ncbi:ATP-binding cassette domain-containing protein [Corynebacterium timonense]|uniref:NitT/TauT family transport system ATP-binding protein n=1 Tax=Corynebacterium timonense TaxID=441500 RepID=A0A1H1SXP2_9CORY|nr:ATP-binding cassette domain-containing protein [Corynebacterium timonense]SDS52169.1 NitT/TauT family transport system ATP-binding protein [Corynebacterium timonense]
MTFGIDGHSMAAGYKRDQPVFTDVSIRMAGPGLRLLSGPNGAGKSTLLEVFSGFLPLLSGSLDVTGEVVFLRHTPALVPFLTVSDNLSLYTRRYGLSADDVRRFVDAFCLQEHLSKLPSELSTGTLRKAWMLCGLLTRSDILCLDEPFNGLDQYSCDVLATELLQQSEERLVLVVAHQPPEKFTIEQDNRFGDLCRSVAGFGLHSVSGVSAETRSFPAEKG